MKDSDRSKWDFGRFYQTLNYFEIVPVISWVQKLFPKPKHKQVQPNGGEQMVVLVAGATGGVGKRVVQRLQAQGYQVRSLVRDLEQARAILGNSTDLVVADITKPETLTSLVMGNIQAVICCTAVRVQPVSGDTPNREKYYQGVKFYQPEIVGDTPENVEYKGVKNLVEAASKYLPKSNDKLIFDFTNPSIEVRDIWGALDDVVMGGVSESNIRLISDGALFAGNVSTANSGGFASIRTKNFSPNLDLSNYEGIDLRVKGDGKRYKFFVRAESKWDGIGYSYSFDTVPNIWITVRIPFADLIPVFRAKTVKDCPPVDTSNICSFQLMLSKFEYDGELNPRFSPGNFNLQIESIKAYGANLPQFVLVSSAGVTRPNRPGINLDEEPPAVRLNDQLGGILTWKLKGEDSLRASRIPYTIIRPCALTEEPGGNELIVEQGDNIRGRISREDVAELCVAALQQSKACNVTLEVKEGEKKVTNIDWQGLFAQLQLS
ncbi:MAG: CIA30 family protein [Calothrix sp. MO_167.B12]|nr:CIA30 family protein [Calothrix sp. MO_167.B12]